MSYTDGFIIAVPTAKKAEYLKHIQTTARIFIEFGAIGVSENWGDQVPVGKVTDFQRSVQATADETIVFSWVTWPDRASRDAGWAKMMADPRMAAMPTPPFDGQRMIYGGFENLLTM